MYGYCDIKYTSVILLFWFPLALICVVWASKLVVEVKTAKRCAKILMVHHHSRVKSIVQSFGIEIFMSFSVFHRVAPVKSSSFQET